MYGCLRKSPLQVKRRCALPGRRISRGQRRCLLQHGAEAVPFVFANKCCRLGPLSAFMSDRLRAFLLRRMSWSSPSPGSKDVRGGSPSRGSRFSPDTAQAGLRGEREVSFYRGERDARKIESFRLSSYRTKRVAPSALALRRKLAARAC